MRCPTGEERSIDPRQLILAAALVTIELVSGMQTYVTQLVMPMMASSLHAQRYYGVVNGGTMICQFLFLPLGALFIGRFALPRLLSVFTVVTILGGFVSAFARSIEIFALGRFVAASAGGVLAIISMGAVARGLTGTYRRLTLAFSSASWVIAAVAGPVYGAWVTTALSWRWALLLYLPFLLAGRLVVARHLPPGEGHSTPDFTARDAFLLAGSLGLLSVPLDGTGNWIPFCAGTVGVIIASRRLLPDGTFGVTRNLRVRSISLLYLVTAAYFGIDALISVVGHDDLGLRSREIGTVLLSGGVTWGLVGLWCGARPAGNYRIRASWGIALIITGMAIMAVGISQRQYALTFFCGGWSLAGLGMGMFYVDTLNIAFDDGLDGGALSAEDAGSAAVMSESISTAWTTTTFLSLFASTAQTVAMPLTLFGVAILLCLVALVQTAGMVRPEPRIPV